MQVRAGPELADALKARAETGRRPVSEVARTALREYLERVASVDTGVGEHQKRKTGPCPDRCRARGDFQAKETL